ncbi:MAG TPA: AAA family ATPase [Solirubrobacterales bacterium]|jgi:rubrerythrin
MSSDPNDGGKPTLQVGEPESQVSLDISPSPEVSISLQERIYEWSTDLPPWQRDLLRRLAHGPLSRDDEGAILKILLETNDAPAPKPLERTDLPVDEAEGGSVELREIRDVQNVNLLAEGRALRFKPGINVVFGATGAGKSGYGRLLRRLCQPADRVKVLRNAFDEGSKDTRQTAVVRFAIGGEEREITVNLAAESERALTAMSVFDAACAPVHVSKPNFIEHVPEPLRLLRRLAEAQEVLRSRVREQIETLQDKLPQPDVDPVTPIGHLAASITAETDPNEIQRLATLSDEEQAQLKRLDAEIAAFGSDQSRQLEAAARARARTAGRVAGQLERAAEKLVDAHLQAVDALRTRLDEATAAERSLAAEAFSGQRFSGVGQELWREMWEAARCFVEADGHVFPSGRPDAACPLCQQDLAGDTPERVAKLEEFVGSDLRGKIAALSSDLARAVDELPDIAAVRALVEASFSEAPDEVKGAAIDMVNALSARVGLVCRLGTGSVAGLGPAPELPPIASIRAYARAELDVADSQKGFRDGAAQQRLMARRAELRGREELGAALPKILEHIAALVKIDKYKNAAARLGTGRISARLRTLQEDIVTDRLRSAIGNELKAVDLLAEEIDVHGGAKGERPTIAFGLRGGGQANVGDVLSDGEQRALALAFFLAESSVSDDRSAIVLDDPAALLDFERREHVARRLVEEARQRQVIVFTHDLAFVQMLQQAAAAADQELHSQALQRRYGRAGMPGDDHLLAVPAHPTKPSGPLGSGPRPTEQLPEPT